jgi:hypothetical protein
LDVSTTYITTPINGEFRPHIRNEQLRVGTERRAQLVWWALERPDAPSSQPWAQTVEDLLQYVDCVWTSAGYLAGQEPDAFLPLALRQQVRWVTLGSHPELALRPMAGRPMAEFGPGLEYDVAMMAYMVPRRQRIEDDLRKVGLRVAPHGWGEERDRILRSTGVMLNVHQHNNPQLIAEPLRFALAAAYRMALVSESIAYPWPLEPGVHYADVKYGNLVATVDAVRRGPLASEMGEALYELLCVQQTFRDGVERALVGGVPR